MGTIGERIQRLREARGLSRADLAYTINITPQGMAAIENGETKSPSFPVGLKIARALNVSPWEIAFGKPEPRRPIRAERDAADEDRLSALAAQMETVTLRAETEKREDRLTRLERYATIHHEVLEHLLHTASVADRLPNLLERLALLVPGSEALVEEIRTLREST
jgi:transcriptional regulator with XRE-family HTH domain